MILGQGTQHHAWWIFVALIESSLGVPECLVALHGHYTHILVLCCFIKPPHFPAVFRTLALS